MRLKRRREDGEKRVVGVGDIIRIGSVCGVRTGNVTRTAVLEGFMGVGGVDGISGVGSVMDTTCVRSVVGGKSFRSVAIRERPMTNLTSTC